MKVLLSALGLYGAFVHATTSNLHLEHDSSPITVVGLLGFSTLDQPELTALSTCAPGSTCQLSNVMGYCNARPSQQATVLGASQCVKALRSKHPDQPIALSGTKTHRVEEYTSRDKSLESVTTVLGVRSPNGLGKTVSRGMVARMVEATVIGCRRPGCRGGRCPMSIVSSELGGNVEVWIWGEKEEWEPEAKLGPSAGVMGTKGHKDGDLEEQEVTPVKES